MRESMVAAIVETDDALTEKYLGGEALTTEELKRALREGVLTRRFIPVYLGSALKNMGVNFLMDAVNLTLPSPLDKGAIRGHVKGINPRTLEETEHEPDPSAPFAAFVFKSLIDPYTGKLSIFRIFSGTIHSDATVLNSTRDAKEKLTHLYLMEGKKLREVTKAEAGDIIAVSKLKDTHIGDTLTDVVSPVRFAPFPPVDGDPLLRHTPEDKGRRGQGPRRDREAHGRGPVDRLPHGRADKGIFALRRGAGTP